MHPADSLWLKRHTAQSHIRTFSVRLEKYYQNYENEFKFETFKQYISDRRSDLNDYGFDAKVIHTPGHTKGSMPS